MIHIYFACLGTVPLFMPTGGSVFRVGGGVKFSKSMKKGVVFFKYSRNKGVNF